MNRHGFWQAWPPRAPRARGAARVAIQNLSKISALVNRNADCSGAPAAARGGDAEGEERGPPGLRRNGAARLGRSS